MEGGQGVPNPASRVILEHPKLNKMFITSSKYVTCMYTCMVYIPVRITPKV